MLRKACGNNNGSVPWKIGRRPAMALSDVSVGLKSELQGRSERRKLVVSSITHSAGRRGRQPSSPLVLEE